MIPITIAIPTYNRSQYLKEAIKSVISQTFEDFELIIIDNDSSDDTKKVVMSFVDRRIKYYKNKRNIGMINNWNKCIRLARSKYILILGDDDKLYPDFLSESYNIHLKYPKLGFTFTHCNKVNEKGDYLMRWGYQFSPGGYLKGNNYLYLTIKYGCCLSNSSTVLVRKDVFKKVGLFKQVYGANTFDFNMWIRIANDYDLYFIDKVLVDYRLHPKQVSEIHWRRPESPTGKIGTYLEIFDAIAKLFQNPEHKDKTKRNFLIKRLVEINTDLSRLLKQVILEL